MDKLISIFEGFDIENIGKMLPSAETVMGRLPGWMALLVLIGPLLILTLGVIYLFFPPKEANYAVGYRFFYAMSRVKVWQYTQRLAGIAYLVLGGILFLIMGLISLSFGHLAAPDLVWRAVKCLIWEVVLILIVTIGVDILIMVRYDYNGKPRKSSTKWTKARRRRPAGMGPSDSHRP